MRGRIPVVRRWSCVTCTSRIGVRRSPGFMLKRGTARISAFRYGWRASRKMSVTLPDSITWPRCSTTTSSAMFATTPRSCVMSSTAMPNSFCRSWISWRICAWMVTSSAVVGSSAISSAGRHTSAMAIIARWRRPPESSNG